MASDQTFLSGLKVREIGPDLDLTRFQCKEEIDWFLRERACDHHEKRMSVAMCWLDGNELAGYMTTSMGYTEHDDSSWRGLLGLVGVKLRPNGKDLKRFPAMLIGMLGVDQRYRGRGLGRHMVKAAVVSALAAADTVGCRIVHVDSDRTPEALALYKSAGFVMPDGQDPKRATAWMYFDLGVRQPR
jgi:ribosomal protein S18 acetylase RimI-like enzyme